MENREYLCQIDKTGYLEEGIRRFPSIYIEGNAASGKTTLVEMFLKKHPEISFLKLDMQKEELDLAKFIEKGKSISCQIQEKKKWLILENVPAKMNPAMAKIFIEMVENIPEEVHVLFLSRSKPDEQLLDLVWKGKMGILPMERLMFSRKEVQQLVKSRQISLSVEEIYQKTGGWPGCVMVLLHLAEIMPHKSIEELLQSYEIKTYISAKILKELTPEENEILSYAAGCPWINEKFLHEFCSMENSEELLENLQRKGFLIFERERHRWKMFALFRQYLTSHLPELGKENVWYEQEGYLAEAFECVKRTGSESYERKMMLKYWDKVANLDLITENALNWKGKTPQECYIRGVYYHKTQQFEKLQKEINNLQKNSLRDFTVKEILINLCYLDPGMSLQEWIELVEKEQEADKKFRLYEMLGNSVSYLCGKRDLSGLFACDAKEEKRLARIWKTVFGDKERKCYRLAKIDYYLETQKKDNISEKDWYFLEEIDSSQDHWRIRISKLYLLCKSQKMHMEEMQSDKIKKLEAVLSQEENGICRALTEAVISLYAPWYGEKEKMAKWLRSIEKEQGINVNEDNYMILCCRAKGYLRLNQFERSEKLLKKLIPYLQMYHRNRFLSELIFEYAVINWQRELKGQAVKNMIESFLICSNSRYVRFYTEYGIYGQQVLEAYIEWKKASEPTRWSHKKKYYYGNVQRMPLEDYLDMVVRNAKKMTRQTKDLQEKDTTEHLTMMEMIILQNLGRGMSNAEICEELDLKLPTVKGHIYNLFKKLEVKNRGQAVVRAKELGLLE